MAWIIAVVGCGSIGRRHIRTLLQLGEHHVIAVDTNPERRHSVQAELGVRTMNSTDDALAAGANVVFVTLPSALHHEVLLDAIKAGCHIFMEKPLAVSSDGMAQVLKVAREQGLVGFMGSNFKFHPGFQRMKALLQQNSIGRVLSARVIAGQYLPDWHPWEDYRRGYSAQECLGGGILFDSHEITYLSWFLGAVAKIACMADRLSTLEIDTEDTASVLLKMQCGAQVLVQLDYNQRIPLRAYEFHGSEGTIMWDMHARAVRHYTASDRRWEVWEEPADYTFDRMYVDQMVHFLACLRGEESPLTPLEEGLYVLRLLEAAKTSSAQERFIAVPQ